MLRLCESYLEIRLFDSETIFWRKFEKKSMKYFIVISLAFVLFSCKKECPADVCADADLTKGLLAYYPFNNSANDESGKGNNATAYNGAHFAADHLGRPNKAAEFDGVDDYFLVQDNGKLSSEEVTVSMMVMLNNSSRRQSLLNRVNSNSTGAFTYGLGQRYDGTNRWDFGVGDPKDNCSVILPNDETTYVGSVQATLPGQWYHLIGVFSKGSQKLFIDGELKSSSTRTFQTLKSCAEAQLMIGGWWKNDVISVSGKIDEIRIYNRVLLDCEMKELTSMFK